MNKLKKSLALVAMLAIASTAFVGCGDDTDAGNKPADTTAAPAETTAAPADDDADTEETTPADDAAPAIKFEDSDPTLTVLCWTGDDINKMIENFGDSNVKYVNVGSNGQEAREQYTTYFAGGEDVDLFVLEADWILDYINNDEYCAPLSDLGFTEADFDGCYDYTVSIGTNEAGVLKAASWQATPGAYVYRTDLAESILGAKTRDEMQALCKDWATFEKTAETAAAKGVAMADTLGGMWQVYQYNKDSAWVVDNKLVVDDYCKDYAELAKRWYDKGYVTNVAQWAEDGSWYQIGQDGKTMGYFFCTWCLGAGSMLSNASGGLNDDGTPVNPDVYGKWNICTGPSSYAWGGSWLAVSPKCNTGTLAHDFVEYFTVNEESMEEYALFKSEFVNNPTVMKKIVDDGANKNPLLGGEDQFAVLYEAAGLIDMDGKITKYDSVIKGDFNDAVNKYVNGDYADVDTMITEFKKSVAADVEGIEVE